MPDPSEPEKNDHDHDSQPPAAKQLKPLPGSSTGTGRTGGNWLNDLARRSTGLPQDESPPPNPDRAETAKLWKLAGLGIQFAATIALFAFMGYALDKKMGWSPWGLVTGAFIALVGNLYLLIKESLKEDGHPKAPRRPPRQS